MAKNDTQKRGGHPVLVTLVILLVIVCVVGGYALAMVGSAKRAMGYAQQMESAVQHVEDAASAGELSMAMVRSNAQALTRGASQLRGETDGVLWQIATYIPVYGQDAAAVRTLAQVADDLCANAVNPVVDALPSDDFETLGALEQLQAGAEALSALSDVMPAVTDAVHAAATQVDGIGTLHIEQLNQAVASIREPLDQTDAALSNASDALDTLMGLLGE